MNNLITIALLGAFAAAQGNSANAHDAEFMNFNAKFNKHPKDKKEFDKRKALFEDSLNQAKAHNSRPSKFKMGATRFSDMTPEEQDQYKGSSGKNLDDGNRRLASDHKDSGRRNLTQTTNMIDWASQGVMSPVKDQGSCGSCWAFVGVSVLEAMEVIHGLTASPDILSTQHGVDCTYAYDTSRGGCDGGWPEQYWGMTRNDPAPTEQSYPYTGQDRAADGTVLPCRTDNRVPAARVVDYEWIGWGYEPLDPLVILQNLINGPLAIFVAVDGGFMGYTGGVLDSTASCSSDAWAINHTIVLTGYEETVDVAATAEKCVPKDFRSGLCPAGTSETGDVMFPCCGSEEADRVLTSVWTAQNSWGAGWGEGGFVRIEAQTGAGVCGMNWGIEYILATDSTYY